MWHVEPIGKWLCTPRPPTLAGGHLVRRGGASDHAAGPVLMGHHVLQGALLHDHLLLLPPLLFVKLLLQLQPRYLLRGHVIQVVGA